MPKVSNIHRIYSTEGNVFGEMDIISFGTRDSYIETIEESDICLMNKDRFELF